MLLRLWARLECGNRALMRPLGRTTVIFALRRVPTRLLMLPLMMLGCGLSACAPAIVAAPSACSILLPPDWVTPAPAPDLPAGPNVGDWVAFGDAAIAWGEKGYGRAADAIGIVSRCEQRDAASIKHARGKLLGIIPR